MNKLNIILFLFLTQSIFSQNFTKISDTEFNNATFESLNYLIEDLKPVNIVGLGETTHSGGKTFTAKIKMVKFLHEKCGFNVLAFESPMYNLSKINKSLKNNTATIKLLKRTISGVWNTTEMLELYSYILETQKTENPIEYVGFDEAFFPSKTLVEDYSDFIKTLNKKIEKKIEVDSLFYKAINETADKCYYYSKRTPKDTLLMFNKFKEIRKSLQKINYKNEEYLYFWKLITDNLQSVYRKNYLKSKREKLMAENISFLLQKNKKIILWAATFHLFSNPKSITPKSNNFKKKPMGYYLREKYKEKYYFIAFSPMQGRVGYKGYLGLTKKKIKSTKGSIEQYVNDNYKTNFAYIPLRKQKIKEEIFDNNLIKSNLIWMGGKINGVQMNISEAADAIFYLKEEHLVNTEL